MRKGYDLKYPFLIHLKYIHEIRNANVSRYGLSQSIS